eukprot:TRINITY_DN17859_c0_g1_i1.p1 TRINITY_DN17859_c0_g1~~TRINITY_DN17859_c0_g1_i1.p1  ORF type:complete len:128 (-),score=12.87 TRINITY_DN17859_c0_g1_i1:192-575(-)
MMKLPFAAALIAIVLLTGTFGAPTQLAQFEVTGRQGGQGGNGGAGREGGRGGNGGRGNEKQSTKDGDAGRDGESLPNHERRGPSLSISSAIDNLRGLFRTSESSGGSGPSGQVVLPALSGSSGQVTR